MTPLWRLARRIHAARESLARGAQLTGGRWNPRGVPVVYSGSSIALVALEYFVHLAGEAPADLVLLRIEVPDAASAEVLAPTALAEGWQEDLAATQRRGREWIESRRTLLLRVPSAIVPEEFNVLLNPAHPQWDSVEVRLLRAFGYDRRMYKS